MKTTLRFFATGLMGALASTFLPSSAAAQGPPVAQAPAAAYPQAPVYEFFSPNFGMSYQLVPYYGAYGARLTRYPVPGSPAARLFLEPGDMIVEADGLRFFSPADVNNHVQYTTLSFVNIRTNRLQYAAVFIP